MARSFTAAARLARLGRRASRRVLRSRPAVAVVTLTWMIAGLPLAVFRLAVLARET